MRSDEFAERWLAPDLGRLWEVATVLGVRPDGSDAATLRRCDAATLRRCDWSYQGRRTSQPGSTTWCACAGAGRPAKLYRRSSRQLAVILPARRYERVGRLLATAVTDVERKG